MQFYPGYGSRISTEMCRSTNSEEDRDIVIERKREREKREERREKERYRA